MAQVIETIDVDVPVEQAYNQWTQFESFPHFLSFVESIQQQDATHNQTHRVHRLTTSRCAHGIAAGCGLVSDDWRTVA